MESMLDRWIRAGCFDALSWTYKERTFGWIGIPAPSRLFFDREEDMKKKPKTTKHGTVKKIIKSPDPRVPEKAEVQVHEADELYREIRIENELEDDSGKKVKLKEDAPVDITVEADTKATTPDNNEKR